MNAFTKYNLQMHKLIHIYKSLQKMPDAKILWKYIILWNRLTKDYILARQSNIIFYFLWTDNSLKIIVFTKYKWQMRKLFKIQCSNKMTGTNILWKYIISHALMCLQNIIHKCVSRFIYLHINSQTHNLIHIHQMTCKYTTKFTFTKYDF